MLKSKVLLFDWNECDSAFLLLVYCNNIIQFLYPAILLDCWEDSQLEVEKRNKGFHRHLQINLRRGIYHSSYGSSSSARYQTLVSKIWNEGNWYGICHTKQKSAFKKPHCIRLAAFLTGCLFWALEVWSQLFWGSKHLSLNILTLKLSTL